MTGVVRHPVVLDTNDADINSMVTAARLALKEKYSRSLADEIMTIPTAVPYRNGLYTEFVQKSVHNPIGAQGTLKVSYAFLRPTISQ